MNIKWLGHSCFLLTSAAGVRILTDPFNETVGYPLPTVEADIVTTSHDHFDHNYIQAVRGKFVHIKEPGSFTEKGIELKGIAVFHDETHGSQRGKNIIYKSTIDGLNICHCGDLGHMLTAEQAQEIGPVDILLIPVGGVYTVDFETAAKICSLLKPMLTIPMHFKTPVLGFPIATVEPFLEKMGGKRLGKQELAVTKENIAAMAGVIVLNYE